MCPTGMIAHVSSILRYFESKVPPTTAINSIGIGTGDLLATRDFRNSLLKIRMVIVMIESRIAT